MSPIDWRFDPTIYIADDFQKDVDYDALTDVEAYSQRHDRYTLIWLDASIDEGNRDCQYSIHQLRLFFDSMIIFTDAERCLMFIERFYKNNKFLLMVSGSLGPKFLPNVNYLSQIYSAYVFCGRKQHHQSWAAKYKKVVGVYDNILDLCEDLKRDKQRLEENRAHGIDDLSSSHSFKTEPNDHQTDDYIQRAIVAEDIPLDQDEINLSVDLLEINNCIESSETVTLYMEHQHPLVTSDNGIWPRVSVIDSSSLTDRVRHLRSSIGAVHYASSVEQCLQYVEENSDHPHFVVLCNPTDIDQLPTLFCCSIRKVYLHSSMDRYNELTALTANHSDVVSVLQHLDTLTRLILWDLSICSVEIGNRYDTANQTDLAQARYQYAYHLRVIIEQELDDRIQMIESRQLIGLMD